MSLNTYNTSCTGIVPGVAPAYPFAYLSNARLTSTSRSASVLPYAESSRDDDKKPLGRGLKLNGPGGLRCGLGLSSRLRGGASDAARADVGRVRRAEPLEAVHHEVMLVAGEAYQVFAVVREPVHVHVLEPGHRLHLFVAPAETFSRARGWTDGATTGGAKVRRAAGCDGRDAGAVVSEAGARTRIAASSARGAPRKSSPWVVSWVATSGTSRSAVRGRTV